MAKDSFLLCKALALFQKVQVILLEIFIANWTMAIQCETLSGIETVHLNCRQIAQGINNVYDANAYIVAIISIKHV
jgi:hypothetical protein